MHPISRRRFITGTALACIALDGPAHGQPAGETAADGFRILRARPGTAELRGPGKPPTAIWGYDGAVPGPVLKVRRGEVVKVRLVNDLPEPTVIHWHGVRIANAMDGVPALTQTPVAPGASFDYRFAAPDAGTFWYHPHEGRQLARGLSGLLIVEEAQAVEVDRDVALVLSEWKLTEAGTLEEAGARGHPTVNGQPALDIPVRANERLRLRLLNAARARMLSLRIDRHRAEVMAVDGEPADPLPARDSRVTLGPGNRIDLFVDATLAPGASAPVILEEAGAEVPLARLVYDASAPARAAPRPDPRPLPGNGLPEKMDFPRALRLDVAIDGAEKNSLGGPPLLSVKRGRTVALAFANRTSAVQIMHLHGHHVRLLDNLDDGWKPFWLDTLPIPPRQTLRIAFVADNPGKWLLQARALDAPGALTAWFEVT